MTAARRPPSLRWAESRDSLHRLSMIRPSALNALMIFVGLLALLALWPALRQGGLDAFLAALPGVTQAIGGLLAIWATYHIAAR